MPRKPYRNPREWARDPADFGVAERVRWNRPTTPTEQAELWGAQLQHALARRIKDLRDSQPVSQRLSTEQIARQIGLNVETVRRILNGRRHATLTEIAAIAHVFNVRFEAGIPR